MDACTFHGSNELRNKVKGVMLEMISLYLLHCVFINLHTVLV